MNTAVVHARARTSIGMFTEDGGPGGNRSSSWVMDAWSGTALSGSILNFAALVQYNPESVNSYVNPNSLLCGDTGQAGTHGE